MSSELLTLLVAVLGFLGVILTQLVNARSERRRLLTEQDRWAVDRRSERAEVWRETKRLAFLKYLNAHTDYWQAREEIQSRIVTEAALADVEEKSAWAAETSQKQMDLFEMR